jgi:diguanylate cyclase (GGDEF)-like protein
MQSPLVPADEKERISQLKSLNILDTPPEERFDRVTRMARRLFGVPIALVSLIDENRQWFKSCFGLPVKETDRDISFCGHAILASGTLVINDALLDERFADNPLVTGEPNIRFYAGHPLRTMSGQAMGTLCIIDKEPRDFVQDDHDMLADLAGMIEREMMAVQLAVSDELTRISNRRGFLALSKYSLELCKRQLFPATLVFFDLDKFKHINDTYGHHAGDTVLKIIGSRISRTIGDAGMTARIGGDEFIVLLYHELDREHVLRRCEQLIESVSLPVLFEGGMADVGASVGVAWWPDDALTAKSVIKCADGALYRAKEMGRGQTCFARPDLANTKTPDTLRGEAA